VHHVSFGVESAASGSGSGRRRPALHRRAGRAAQAAGLLAISLGLSRCFTNDHEQIQHGFVVYDALYAWVREARDEKLTWNPQRVA